MQKYYYFQILKILKEVIFTKYFGEDSKQDFIDCLYEGEITIYYKDAIYDIWLDGNGYCLGMIYFKDKQVTGKEHEESIQAFETPELLCENAILYDGTKFSDGAEMNHT